MQGKRNLCECHTRFFSRDCKTVLSSSSSYNYYYYFSFLTGFIIIYYHRIIFWKTVFSVPKIQSQLAVQAVRFSQTPLYEELNSSITNYLLAATRWDKGATWVLPILTFGYKRTSLKKRPKMLKTQGGQNFSHTLEQTLFGARNHLHAEMKTNGQWAWRRRMEEYERGAEKRWRGRSRVENWFVSRREEGESFSLGSVREALAARSRTLGYLLCRVRESSVSVTADFFFFSITNLQTPSSFLTWGQLYV